jgi:hypothetical protein
MPFDVTLPAANSQISSTELHNQFNGLRTLVDLKATVTGLNDAILTTAKNPQHVVSTLALTLVRLPRFVGLTLQKAERT